VSHQLLAAKIADLEINARLINWGRWLRWDSTIARLGYPTQCPFVFSPRKGKMIADLDAEHIEWVVSSLYMAGTKPGFELSLLYAFVLRVEFAERPENSQPHVSQKAEDVRRRFKRPCAERSYYRHLYNAKLAVMVWAEEMK